MAKNQVIEALLELHGVDTEIDKLKSQQQLLPTSLRRIETRLARQREAISQKQERMKGLRAESHAKEVVLRAIEGEIQKLTNQIRKARTNREYTTLQHEISGKTVDTSRIEDEVLAVMADIEGIETEVKELKESVAQIQREQENEGKLVDKEVEHIGERLAKLRGQRGGAAAKVETDLLGEYERMAARKGSSALAVVVSRTCQGCFMQIPPQLDQDLRSGAKIVHCPSCSRILYLP